MVELFLFYIFVVNKKTRNMESQTLSKELSLIDEKTYNLFNRLVSKNSFNFLVQVSENTKLLVNQMIDEIINDYMLDALPMIEVRNEIAGKTYMAYVCLVNDKRILVVNSDTEKKVDIKFSDIATLEDKLVLLNEMEEYLVETN